MPELIKVTHVTKDYVIKNIDQKSKLRDFLHPTYKTINAVQDVSFLVNKGDIIGYVGENGAGKSTTIKMLLGILQPTKGTVEVFGKNPFNNRKNVAPMIGALMGQKTQLWWELPLIDSFKFLQKMYCKDSSEDNVWLNELIGRLNVTDFINQPVRALSLGQRMRGEFIATFLHKPQLVFLDEPTLGLDVNTRKEVMDFLLEINRRYATTIFFTSHELEDVEKVANRLLLLDKGQISYHGNMGQFVGGYDCYSLVEVTTANEPQVPLQQGVTLYQKNKETIDYLVDTRLVSIANATSVFTESKGVTGIKILPLSLETILAIRR